MKTLLIDVPSPPLIVPNNKNSKIFFMLLSFVKQAKKMATIFANRLFNYFLIIIDNILPNHINFANATCNTIQTNLFAYIITDRYLLEKLHGIMIDTNASYYFIVSYEQFMAYTRNIKYTIINIA